MTRTYDAIRPPRIPLRLRTVLALVPRFNLLGFLPLRRRTQAVIAEGLSQAIASGMDVAQACDVVSRTMRRARPRRYLHTAAGYVREAGNLAECLEMAGMSLHTDLRAALEIGESRGCLAPELTAAAHRLDPLIDVHFPRAIRRRDAVRQFAATLSRLLVGHPLTIDLVLDAARRVGRRDKRFHRAAQRLADDIEGGLPFADALAEQPKIFDPLLVACIAHAHTREATRQVLMRLGGSADGRAS